MTEVPITSSFHINLARPGLGGPQGVEPAVVDYWRLPPGSYQVQETTDGINWENRSPIKNDRDYYFTHTIFLLQPIRIQRVVIP